jgi:hypothetical protein
MAEALRDQGEANPIERYELEEDVLESFLEGTREFVLMQHGKIAWDRAGCCGAPRIFSQGI